MNVYIFKNSTFATFLEKVRSRPGLFLGKKSLTGLWNLLSGYQQAAIEHEIPESERLDCSLENEFDHWLRQKYRMGNAIGWYVFVVHMTESEEQAWELFFKLWDEFWRERVVASEATLS